MYDRLAALRRQDGDWELLRALHWDGFMMVPKGFITDLDSVPRIPILHAVFKGRAVESAVIHDYYYRTRQTRSYADTAFLQAMVIEGVPRRYRYPIYWAVRLFGRRGYNLAMEKTYRN